MVTVWRFQQSQMLIGILFWTLTLTLLTYPYLAPWLHRTGLDQSQVALGILFVFFLVFATIVVVGFLYDRVFRLWRDQIVVATERNPYAHDKMTPMQILWFEFVFIPLLEDKEARNGARPSHSAVGRALVKYNLENDQILKKDYETLRRTMVEEAERTGANFPDLIPTSEAPRGPT